VFDFTLDPAASHDNHLTTYYCVAPDEPTPEAYPGGCVAVDGLKFDWTSERVWLNPPYSDPGPWALKAAASDALTVALLPVDPSTNWWQHWVRGKCNEACRWWV